MLRNYIVVGVRALLKNRAYAAINIVGLAIGIAACLLILLYVRDQESFDRFFPDHARVYQLQSEQTDPDSGRVDRLQMAPYPTAALLAKDFGAVEAFTYATNSQPIALIDGQPRELPFTLTEANFFSVFKVRFLKGDAATALRDPNAVALDLSQARKLFKTDDPVGRTLVVSSRGTTTSYRVSAVFADLPKTSHQQFHIVRALRDGDMSVDTRTGWGNYNGYVYVKLRQGADIAPINAGLEAWKTKEAPRNLVGGQMRSDAETVHFKLVPLADIHLGGAGSGPAGNEGDRTTVTTFAVLAVLVLLMACVNFVNLATARASQRAREVSLRKVLGAARSQLVAQFLVESVIVAAVATTMALAIVELALPFLRNYLNTDLAYSYLGRDGILPPAILLTLLVGIAGGLYPAFFLSRFRPAQVLKANRSSADPSGSGLLRSILVVSQFAISIGLIICTAVVFAQIRHIRTVDPGFRRENILQVEDLGRSQVAPSAETLRREIERVSGVKSAALTRIGMSTDSWSRNNVLLPGRTRPLVLGTYGIDYGYFETMGMTLLAGRTLDRAYARDDATLPTEQDNAAEQALVRRGANVVVNATAARRMGYSDPATAVGKTVGISLVANENGIVPCTIVGVVGDTRFRSAHQQVEDMIFFRNPIGLSYLEVRIDGNDPLGTRARVEQVWKRIVPQVPFSADFADERAARLYRTDAATGQVFGGFAVLSVIVGCLGLFGLAAFTAERRTKEIGIRKVLGARTRDIVRLLVWQFSRPVLIANLIAWPIAWYVMRGWLDRFDERIGLTPLPFVAAGALALAIAVATIAAHAMKVARANPIRALRYE